MNTGRSTGGAHTVVAAPVANAHRDLGNVVGRGRERCRLHPRGHLDRTKPGRTTSTRTPDPERIGEPLHELVRARLRGAVHEVRLAHPLAATDDK